MSKSFKALGLAVGALALTHLPASAQTKVTNEGISANEIVIGTHQDLSGPIKVWGVPVSNGMKMAVEEINAAGGINGDNAAEYAATGVDVLVTSWPYWGRPADMKVVMEADAR